MKKKFALLLACIAIITVSVIHFVIIPESHYQEAVMLMEQGAYLEASETFAKLSNYRDSANRVYEPYYLQGKQLYENGYFEQAISSFEQANGFQDSNELIHECKYRLGEMFVQAGQYREAVSIYVTIRDYKDVAQLLDENPNLSSAVLSIRCDTFTRGNEIILGEYEQDGNTNNGKEPVEWIVLTCDGQNALLISKYGLDVQTYHTEKCRITWENSALRNWLNTEFIDTTFSPYEQEGILLVTLDNSAPRSGKASDWKSESGADTQDKVFLLSYQEVITYFTSTASRKCEPTKYADKMKPDNYTDTCDWWLRSSGITNYYGASIRYDGEITGNSDVGDDGSNRIPLYRLKEFVRPAIWVNIQSDVFFDTSVTAYAMDGSIFEAEDEESQGTWNSWAYYSEFDGTCSKSHCDRTARDGKLYCWAHACCKDGCNRSKDPSAHCCSIHCCAHEGCGLHRYDYAGSKYCKVHMDEH